MAHFQQIIGCLVNMSGAMVNHFERSHERFTWRGVLHTHVDPKKRKGFKILSRPRDRVKDKTINVPGLFYFLSSLILMMMHVIIFCNYRQLCLLLPGHRP